MWIRVDASLADHKKTRVVSTRLTRTCSSCGHADELGVPATVGHLVLLWLKCLDQAVDGDLSLNSEPADLAFFARWDGDPAEFAAALQEVGFLEDTGEGITVHDWMDYAGSLKAALQKRRQRKSKKKKKRLTLVHGQSKDSPRTVAEMSTRTDGTDVTDGTDRHDPAPDSPPTDPPNPDPAPAQPDDVTPALIKPSDVEQEGILAFGKGWMADSSRQLVMELGPITREEWDAAVAVTKEKAQTPCLAYCLTRIRSGRATQTKPQENRDATLGYHRGSDSFGDGDQPL